VAILGLSDAFAVATGHTTISKVKAAMNGNAKKSVKCFMIFLLLSNKSVAMVYFCMMVAAEPIASGNLVNRFQIAMFSFFLPPLRLMALKPNLDKPEKWPQRHKAKLFAKIYLSDLVSWWRKCFASSKPPVSRTSAMFISNVSPRTLAAPINTSKSWVLKCFSMAGRVFHSPITL
jgi:hypothetical protein